MHPAFRELFRRKIANARASSSAKDLERINRRRAIARRAAVTTPAPLSLEQRAACAVAIEQIEAVDCGPPGIARRYDLARGLRARGQ